MAGTNQFLPFASGPGANRLAPDAYSALAARQSGYASGLARSVHFNTTWGQSAAMSAMLGQFIAAANFDALDNGDSAALLANFQAALAQIASGAVPSVQRVHTGLDVGSPNSLVAALNPTITAYDLIGFYLIRILNTNTTQAVAEFDGRGVKPILRADGSPTQRGDLPSGAIVALSYDGAALRIVGLAYGEVPRIVSNALLWVNTSGSDNNDGLSNGTALRTIDAALALAQKYFITGSGSTIQLGNAAEFDQPTTLANFRGPVAINGNVNAPSGYIIRGSGPAGGGRGLIEANAGSVTLSGLNIVNASGINSHAAASGGGSLFVDRTIFSGTVTNNGALVYAAGSSVVTFANAVTFATSGANMIGVRNGQIQFSSNTAITVNGNPSFSDAAASALDGGSIFVRGGCTRTGNATGKRYNIAGNGIIRTSGLGVNFFPGDQAGTTEDICSKYYP